jgi:hypothetical protein
VPLTFVKSYVPGDALRVGLAGFVLSHDVSAKERIASLDVRAEGGSVNQEVTGLARGPGAAASTL